MTAGGGLITLVNTRLSREANFTQQIRDMHATGVPLLDMVEQLGLSGAMSDAIRAIVQQLSPTDVAAIRQATIEMLDRGETAMPVDCNLSETDIDHGAPVSVAVVDAAGNGTIRVRPVGEK